MPGHDQLEAELLAAVNIAKAEYEAAKMETRAALATCRDLGSFSPDGALAYPQAIHAGNCAMQKYMSALYAWNRFILNRPAPEYFGASDIRELPATEAPT